ncbi:MAG: TMEM165/GDT1 family protein [Oculatellaceae cyanobacterium bins.114]|nr:TMEM165/GDT1 family protein [Oculatellaceae cyanobacterium bins.114]
MTSLFDPPSVISSELESPDSIPLAERQGLSLTDVTAYQAGSTPAIVEVEVSQPLTDKPTFKCELEIFASTFITIFLAELGDKTQLTTLLMSAESQSPWVVFAGASVALILTSLLGILLGRWLSTKIAPKTLEVSAGVLLLVIAAMLCCDILWS